MTEAQVDTLVCEYESLVQKAAEDVSDERLVALLVAEHDWTPEGASTAVELARKYGTFILRNALALAFALQIDDGSCGL